MMAAADARVYHGKKSGEFPRAWSDLFHDKLGGSLSRSPPKRPTRRRVPYGHTAPFPFARRLSYGKATRPRKSSRRRAPCGRTASAHNACAGLPCGRSAQRYPKTTTRSYVSAMIMAATATSAAQPPATAAQTTAHLTPLSARSTCACRSCRSDSRRSRNPSRNPTVSCLI